MKTILMMMCFAALSLSSVVASAEEWEWVLAPAPSPASAPALREEGPPSPDDERRNEQSKNRSLRRYDRLLRVMAVEGPEFSKEKHDRYAARQGGGIVLAGLGVISLVSGMLTAIISQFVGYDWSFYDDIDEERDDVSSEEEERRDRMAHTGLALILAGVGAIAIGVPLLVNGTRGKNRQRYLRQKDEILGGVSADARLLLQPGPNGGGMALRVSF